MEGLVEAFWAVEEPGWISVVVSPRSSISSTGRLCRLLRDTCLLHGLSSTYVCGKALAESLLDVRADCALSRWKHNFYSLSEHFWGERTQTQLISASPLEKRREFEFLTTDDIPVFLRRSCAFIVWIAEASVCETKTQPRYIDIRLPSSQLLAESRKGRVEFVCISSQQLFRCKTSFLTLEHPCEQMLRVNSIITWNINVDNNAENENICSFFTVLDGCLWALCHVSLFFYALRNELCVFKMPCQVKYSFKD